MSFIWLCQLEDKKKSCDIIMLLFDLITNIRLLLNHRLFERVKK